MNIEHKIVALNKLSLYLGNLEQDELVSVKNNAIAHNAWFDIENINRALIAIRDFLLDEKSLRLVVDRYNLYNVESKKRVGLILAGNIPLVGIHDVLCCFISDCISVIKLSEKDKFLISFLIKKLIDFDSDAAEYFEMVDQKLLKYDAIIATGSNNSSRYFDYYFSSVPNIIRKNRNSIAILSGKETKKELELLKNDIFYYYGLGCRNISKIYVPKDYEFKMLLSVLEEEKGIIHHNKYANNYDYNYALYIMNKANIIKGKNVILLEATNLASRIACLNFEYYNDRSEVESFVQDHVDQLQCVVSNIKLENIDVLGFGEAQSPSFTEYADGIDTIEFLLSI